MFQADTQALESGGIRNQCVTFILPRSMNEAELLAVMLGKHGIEATEELIEPMPEGEDEFSRPVKAFVPESDYDRAYQLFFGDSENEL